MKKLLSLATLLYIVAIHLSAQHPTQNKKSNQEDRADPQLIQEVRSNCKAILNNLPNPNDPKLVFPSSEKTQLSKLRSALSEGSSLPSNTKMPRVEKVFENISAALPTDNKGPGAQNKKKKNEDEDVNKCDTQYKQCKRSCIGAVCNLCEIQLLECLKTQDRKMWISAYNGKIKANQAPTTPPVTKG